MPRGGFGHGFGVRRFGVPLVVSMGMGGSPLLTSLLAGGVGYAVGSNAAPQNLQQLPVSQPAPDTDKALPPPAPSADSGKLAQLKLLGELRESGVLTDDEFERQKQRILNS